MKRRAALFASGLTAAGLLAGCASPRNSLGTTSSPCFLAVPVATEAVHDQGHLAGVRLVSGKELARHARILDLLTARMGRPVHQVCVVSFHGSFRLDAVERPAGRAPAGGSGPVAIVVVTSPQNRLVATFVVQREPLPLRHEVLHRYRLGPPSSSDGSGAGPA